MKKIISIIVLVSLLLNINLPIFSFAIEEVEEPIEKEKNQQGQIKVNQQSQNEETQNIEAKSIEEQTKFEELQSEQQKNQEDEKQATEEKSEEQGLLRNKNQAVVNEAIEEKQDEVEPIELDEKIKQRLNEYGNVDKDNDGEYSKEELESIEFFNLFLYDNTFVDLSGLKYMSNLTRLEISGIYRKDIDFSPIKELKKLEELNLEGYIPDYTFLNELKTLKKLKLDVSYEQELPIDNISNITSLEELDISYYNGDSLEGLNKLKNLKSLKIHNTHKEYIEIESIFELTNLEELEFTVDGIKSINGLENLTKLKKLKLSGYNNQIPYSTEIFEKLTTLENISINDVEPNDIEWLTKLTKLNTINLSTYDRVKLNDRFFEIINELTAENISISIGEVEIDLGILENNEEIEKTFETIPVLKEIVNPESKFYEPNVVLNINENQNENVDPECITIDNENKTIKIKPQANTAKEIKVSSEYHNGISYNFILTWKGPNDDDIVELDEKIKNAIPTYYNIDKNSDGKYSKGELANPNFTNIYISCNNEEINLSGIEYFTFLKEISIYNIQEKIDFSPLTKLEHLVNIRLGGKIDSIETLAQIDKLSLLEIDLYGNQEHQNTDIYSTIEKMTSLRNLTIYTEDTIDTTKLSNLENLQYLRIRQGNDAIINVEPIGHLQNLTILNLGYINGENLKGLEKAQNLKTLEISLRNESKLDTETISKIISLENLDVSNNDINISWIKKLSNLKQLRLTNWNKEFEYTEEFFETIKNTNIEYISIYNTPVLNFGKVENGQTKELKFEDFPVLKEMTDENSIFYVPNLNLKISDYQNYGVDKDCVQIDNENKKIYLTPSENSRKEVKLTSNNGMGKFNNDCIIKWESPEDEEIVDINNETVKKALENEDVDKNQDGKYTKGELSNVDFRTISLYFDSESVDISLLKYMTSLNEISISFQNNNYDIDLSVLKNLKNLEILSVGGNIKDISVIEDLQDLKKLVITVKGENYEEQMRTINKLVNLEELNIYTDNDFDVERLSELKKLKNLHLMAENSKQKINLQEIGILDKVESIYISGYDCSNLKGLEGLKNLKRLEISQYYGSDGYIDIDTDTISKIDGLEYLRLDRYKGKIDWLNNLQNLKELTLTLDFDERVLDESFINTISSLDLETLRIYGNYSLDLGILEPGTVKEYNFSDIPLLNEAMNKESSFYTEDLNVSVSDYQDDRVDVNCIQIDNENKKIYLTVPENAKTKKQININHNIEQFGNYTKLTWSNPGDDELVELNSKIEEILKRDYSHIDTNKDGKFSKGELANLEYFSINCNYNNVNLEDLEYMINLNQLSLYNVLESIDLSPLQQLSGLKRLSISGSFKNITNITELTNLTSLSLSIYNSFTDLNEISKLINLESLYISANSGFDTIDYSKLNKLHNLSLSSSGTTANIDYKDLQNLQSLEELSLYSFNYENLIGIENITSVTNLSISLKDNIAQIDGESISKMPNLKRFSISNFNPNNIQWIKNISGLESLSLYSYENNNVEVDNNFFNAINTFDIKDIHLGGTYIVNLGELENGVEKKYNFVEIPILNAYTDTNSKLYREEYKDFYYNNEEDKNKISINNNDKTISLLPNDNDKKTKYIYNYSINIELKWSNPGDNDIVNLSEPIKRSIGSYIDQNGDGEFSKKELESPNLNYLSISFKNNEEHNLTGIEYLRNINSLSLSLRENADLSEIKKLNKLEYLSINGNYNDISTLKEVTQIKSISLSHYTENALDLSVLKDLNNLEKVRVNSNVSNIVELKDLPNLKELLISYNSDNNKINFNDITLLKGIEHLRLGNINQTDLSGLETMPNLTNLEIKLTDDVIDKLDTSTLQKINTLKELDIYATNDLSWIQNIPSLEVLTLYGYYNFEPSQNLIDAINNSSVDIYLKGSFYTNLGGIYIGDTKEYSLNDVWLIKELTDKNSKLYDENFNIQYSSKEGRISNIEINPTENKIKIKAKEMGADNQNFNINYNYQNKFLGNLYIKWQNIIAGDTQKEIEIKDEILKQALLEKYDFDNDKKITEQDMINIEELDLNNKGIKDITGLEKATNIKYYIDLSNNKIKDATLINQLSKLNDYIYIYLDNNEIEDVIHIKDADFDAISLNGNYIDFSENSENKKIVVEYLTQKCSKYYDENYEEMKEYFSSKEEYINTRLEEYFKYSAANQKAKQLKKGDVNGNGTVDLTDYSMILKHVKGIKTLEGEQKQRADVNANGNIDLTDYSMVLKHVKGIKLLS